MVELAPNSATGKSFDPVHRGYAVLYHEGETNHCPSCGQSHWIVGRLMAECGYCETALPLEHAHGTGAIARFVSAHDTVIRPDPLREPVC
jgi:hypothetical protein